MANIQDILSKNLYIQPPRRDQVYKRPDPLPQGTPDVQEISTSDLKEKKNGEPRK